MLRSDFNFDLPKSLIANFPSKERTACKMLCLDGNTGLVEDKIFIDLESYVKEGDLLVFNDTKVIPARFYGKKETGGAVEFLIERILSSNKALTHIKASKSPKVDTYIILDNDVKIKVVGRDNDLFLIETDVDLLELLNDVGHIPLPPYIERADEDIDKDRYQTVYSKHEGAVAAPTAGLHFDKEQIENLQKKGVSVAYVTLHVGSGTFKPVREDDILKHHMHKEYVSLSNEVAQKVIETHKRGGRVIAVGTTAVRSLESAALYAKENNLGEICEFFNDTSIFIYPGYKYNVVDCLITNFHLPESTLIMLVCAFAGYKNTMNAYEHAVKSNYKFFSYGDCMFITKRTSEIEDFPPSI